MCCSEQFCFRQHVLGYTVRGGISRGVLVCCGCIQEFFTQSPSEKTRFKVLSPRSNASDKRGVSLWTKYIMPRMTLQALGTSWVIQKTNMSVHLKWGLSTRWVRLAKSLFTSCSGGQDCLFAVHL